MWSRRTPRSNTFQRSPVGRHDSRGIRDRRRMKSTSFVIGSDWSRIRDRPAWFSDPGPGEQHRGVGWIVCQMNDPTGHMMSVTINETGMMRLPPLV
jgi:hypothetical protein